MNRPSYQSLAREGLWQNNPALVQLLGLCPLLAVSNTFANSLGLGVTTLVVLTCSNIVISLIRQFLDDSTDHGDCHLRDAGRHSAANIFL